MARALSFCEAQSLGGMVILLWKKALFGKIRALDAVSGPGDRLESLFGYSLAGAFAYPVSPAFNATQGIVDFVNEKMAARGN